MYPCDLNKILEQEHENAKKCRLADFFESYWDHYLQEPHPPLSKEQYKAVTAMRVCRTAALGVDHYVCTHCGEEVEVYHNCRNRFCPTCSWGDTMKWATRIKEEMMTLPHRHVVFTLPHALYPLVKSNGKYLLNVLLRSSAETLKDWIEHKYQLKIGIISVLHTFGEKKDYHVHVHMIVSWGGISKDTHELKSIKGAYVNYPFLQQKFRIKFEDELVSMYNQGTLEHDFKDKVSFLRYLKQINNKNWVIHFEPPMAAPEAVIRYIGRYSKRACLSEYKITAIEGEYISFRYKDYKVIGLDNKPVEKELRLHYRDFFPRLLQHVPFAYFRLVRYYGLYSGKSKIPEAYCNKEQESKETEWEWESPFKCTFCNKEREYLYTIIDMRKTGERTMKFDIQKHSHMIFKRA